MEEMGSGLLASSGACGSIDPLNGLKFGKKIYFEDVGGGVSVSVSGSGSGSGSVSVGGSGSGGGGGISSSRTSASEPTGAGKKGKGVVQGGPRPPRCQVEGCKVDLTGAKAYYCRHKVCGMHSKAPKVIVAGMEQRFCQQCSRFHQLSEFDQGKRSCRRRLAGHNERRRKPPPGPVSRYGRLPSSFHEEGSRFRSFLMDFTHPQLPGAPRNVWPTVAAVDRVSSNQWHRSIDAPHGTPAMHDTHPYMQGPTCASEHPSGQCLAGVADSSCALSLLSTQPWGANTPARNRAPPISASCCFDGAAVSQPVMSSYGTNPWGFKAYGSSSSSHGHQHEMGLGHVTGGEDCQFSGEFELALQGNRQCPDHCPSRAYDHSGYGMHWPL